MSDGPVHGRRIVFPCALLAFSALIGCDERIAVDAESLADDRRLFVADAGWAGGRWDWETEGLRAVVPRGSEDRPPVKFRGLTTLEGDFEIVATYAINEMPRPWREAASNGLEIAIRSPDRVATVFRQATKAGDGCGYYLFQKGMSEPIVRWVENGGRAGRLGLRRVGATLFFLRGETGGPLTEMGSVNFFGRDPILDFAFQGVTTNSTDGIDIRLERLDVRADRIVRHDPSRRAKLMKSFLISWTALGAIAILLAARRPIS